jgi:hypothetical protein
MVAGGGPLLPGGAIIPGGGPSPAAIIAGGGAVPRMTPGAVGGAPQRVAAPLPMGGAYIAPAPGLAPLGRDGSQDIEISESQSSPQSSIDHLNLV